MADPKKGTGKKPKGTGRRLYTDENPRDTVRIKFATPADARATVAKVKRVSKPFARKIQILTVMEQRAKVMGKSQVASAKCNPPFDFSFILKGKTKIRQPVGFGIFASSFFSDFFTPTRSFFGINIDDCSFFILLLIFI